MELIFKARFDENGYLIPPFQTGQTVYYIGADCLTSPDGKMNYKHFKGETKCRGYKWFKHGEEDYIEVYFSSLNAIKEVSADKNEIDKRFKSYEEDSHYTKEYLDKHWAYKGERECYD